MKVRLKENSWIARLAARKLRCDRVALTLGATIHLHNTSRSAFLEDTGWVCHELKHVAQYRHYGLVRFLLLYLAESIRKGYYNNRWEVEARLAETDRRLLEGVTFY
ncbi:eCIS core domain-containing protein [Taibaiella chishuiensis]|uniref:Uncharacterized protein DUF4157 n=1 Tax=Taibaiella chishuiensis TaxID=1434707 RepID=A0A2P8CSR0_9BACT|nr:DUF4157 domain-containing protein [Taibaiella chishuiensis]PSK88015.1 uncharacterized protein DUF4157 [Taibaiella chishuiensis]